MTDILIKNDDLTPDGLLKQQYPDITGRFDCNDANIISLEGAPLKIGGGFYCANTKITSLVGAPMVVGGSCYFSGTKITSLQGISKYYLKEIGGTLFLNNCFNLKSNMLGIILVKKLKEIYFDNEVILNIFNKHLKGDRDLLDCKEELMNGGFKEFAKL